MREWRFKGAEHQRKIWSSNGVLLLGKMMATKTVSATRFSQYEKGDTDKHAEKDRKLSSPEGTRHGQTETQCRARQAARGWETKAGTGDTNIEAYEAYKVPITFSATFGGLLLAVRTPICPTASCRMIFCIDFEFAVKICGFRPPGGNN